MLTIFQALILGIVEGLTEFLPVSSTGHLILAQKALGLASSEGLNAYLVTIQFGAIVAVLALYPKRFAELFSGVADLVRAKATPARGLLINLFVAFLPAALVGLLLDKWIEAHLFNPLTVAAAFVVGGLIMLFVAELPKRTAAVESLTVKNSLSIGLWQVLSLCPGMSRSMTTLSGGFLSGLSAAAAAEFSFLLGAITLGAASLYKLIKFYHAMEALGVVPLIVGLVAAFISAFIVVKLFVGVLTRFGLKPWGYYRFVAAGVVLATLI